jgi:hypothetical protein
MKKVLKHHAESKLDKFVLLFVSTRSKAPARIHIIEKRMGAVSKYPFKGLSHI